MRDAYPYCVTGDHARMVYSRHRTESAAIRKAEFLGRKWTREEGMLHYGSEPRVVRSQDRRVVCVWCPVHGRACAAEAICDESEDACP